MLWDPWTPSDVGIESKRELEKTSLVKLTFYIVPN